MREIINLPEGHKNRCTGNINCCEVSLVRARSAWAQLLSMHTFYINNQNNYCQMYG